MSRKKVFLLVSAQLLKLNKKHFLILLILLVSFPFFFVSGPDSFSPRSYKELWNFGHFIFYAALSCWLVTSKSGLAEKSIGLQLFVASSVALLSGVLIELIQYGFTSRELDVGDVFRNVAGALIGVLWFSPKRAELPSLFSVFFRSALCVVVAVQVFLVGRIIVDEQKMTSQFPLLADFETPLELGRWTGSASRELNKEFLRHGCFSAKVRFGTAEYSNFSLHYFERDWRAYDALLFDIYLPGATDLDISIRVQDAAHRNAGQSYSDRFNRRFLLEPGWNSITIAMADIAHAPSKRLLDLSQVEKVSLFVSRQRQPRTIYLDHFRLEKTALFAH